MLERGEKRKAKTVKDVTRDVPDKNESAERGTHNKEADEIDLAKIFRVQKKILPAEAPE